MRKLWKKIKYLKDQRIKLGGLFQKGPHLQNKLKLSKEIFDNFMKSTGDKEMSTTMALVRMLTALLRDKNISPRLVPIILDEARTFGMEGFSKR